MGASLTTAALLALAPAAHAAVGVTQVSSLPGKALAGNLSGLVVNDGDSAKTATVTVNAMRRATGGALVGKTTVTVPAHGSKVFRVDVRVPSTLKKGTYYLAACTPQGRGDAGQLGCATALSEVKIKGGDPLRGVLANDAFDQLNHSSAKAAHISQAQCSPGPRWLSPPGNKVFPDLGNGGYRSVHTDVFTVYDAPTNLFVPGNHVDQTIQATQCLTSFAFDFDHNSRSNPPRSGPTPPGSDLQVQSVTIDGAPATFEYKQPTYAGDPKGDDDPDPLAHMASNTNPVSATNPNPPACAPVTTAAADQGIPCGTTKLVITPSQPIPAGTTVKVTINYTGRPGVRGNPSVLVNDGWFRNDLPPGEGSMVTTEPGGTEAWMPLNNQASVKPTLDIHTTTNYDPSLTGDQNRVAIGNGRLVSTVVNAPDANFPTGSRTFNWHSAEPVQSYLVEDSVGHFDESERMATAGDVIYYEFQSANIAAAKKVSNKAIMDLQEDITHFQESQVSGPFQFNANGIIVASPSASFEEEMQTKIVFVGGTIAAETFSHENMHQWWGDAVSYSQPRYTFFKEGYADFSQSLYRGRVAGLAAGAEGSPAYNAAFEAAIATRFNSSYNSTSQTFWNVAPSDPSSGTLFNTANTYTRPGMSYAALRNILGADNFRKASTEIQTTYRYGSISPAQEIVVFKKYMPNKSIGCMNKLDAFFKQWWDTSYTGSPAAGNKPSITAPGLAGGGFYDANGGCSDYATPVDGTVNGSVPATLSLTLGAPGTFGTFTPGVAKDYTTSTTATVVSSAGDAALSVADPSSTVPGHLVNGTFSLPTALKAIATSPGGASAGAGALSGSPLTLETYSSPVSNDPAQVLFTQTIGATDALRTGSYSKTLTFTLSTTTP